MNSTRLCGQDGEVSWRLAGVEARKNGEVFCGHVCDGFLRTFRARSSQFRFQAHSENVTENGSRRKCLISNSVWLLLLQRGQRRRTTILRRQTIDAQYY